jgi:hypothetical protein
MQKLPGTIQNYAYRHCNPWAATLQAHWKRLYSDAKK